MKKSKNILLIAFITIFLDLLGFGIIIPVGAYYAESFGASPSVITLLGATYSMMQFFFAPILGKVSDRVGRRPIMLLSIAIAAFGHFLYGFATTLSTLFIARMIAGMGTANIGTAQAIISDCTTKENRSKGMGLIGAAFGLGFVFGPAVGSILSQISPSAPFFGAGILSLLNLILAFFILPETKNEKSLPSKREIIPIQQFKASSQYPNVQSIFLITLFYTIGFGLMEQSIALFIEHVWVDLTLSSSERIALGAKYTGIFLVIIGIVSSIIQGGLIGKLTTKFGSIQLIRWGIVFTSISIVLIPFMSRFSQFWYMLLLAPIMALGTAILNPSKATLLSLSTPPEEQGGIMGINQSFAALGRVIGPACAGFIYEINISFPFWIGGVLLLSSFLFARKCKEI
jgi:MFS transporter, DHA1 family, tetracycline resistance protein